MGLHCLLQAQQVWPLSGAYSSLFIPGSALPLSPLQFLSYLPSAWSKTSPLQAWSKDHTDKKSTQLLP